MKLYAHLSRARRRRAGSSMIEFALGAGVLLAVFSGTFQFGYTFYQYNNLANAVNAGAHFAALRPYDSATETPTTAFKTAVQNMVVYGAPGGGSKPLVPGLSTSHVTLAVDFDKGVPATVTVAVNGYVINAVFGKITCNNKPKVTYAYQGVYAGGF